VSITARSDATLRCRHIRYQIPFPIPTLAGCENSALPSSPPIRLICWNADLAEQRAAVLREAGFTVDSSRLNTSRVIGTIKENPPAAIVIDLDRLPSHGRAVAAALRSSASTRRIPLVFAGGVEEKISAARQEVPDAVFAPWKSAVTAIRKAMKTQPANPVESRPYMERYAGSGLARKLGLQTTIPCALIAAPEGFEESIDGLPEEFTFQSRIAADTKLVIWFVRTSAEMVFAAERASLHMPIGASVWIVYPKRAGSLRCDFVATDVRESALAVGMVDYKICAVDDDWTGMKFARRKK
jgi:hypothetical protein